MRILCLGDIVGQAAVSLINRNLWKIRKDYSIDFVVANGENADVGNGLTSATAEILFKSGIDVITSGNHIWQKKDMRQYLEENGNVLRPANYPPSVPGKGWTLTDFAGRRALVFNVQGTVYMEALDNPFFAADRILSENKGKFDIAIADFHAEATSEKIAFGRYLDGRANIIFGTHTHVQTADEQILPNGSGYITDLGMCGVQTGVLGVSADCIIEKFTTKLPVRFTPAEGTPELRGAVFILEGYDNKVKAVRRFSFSE
ncbi:MAG: TIGR00282 family metallophosphoesterase [Clostridia bacterium]|nr:TIGR00282 family metallophosphoesterase [Clostridia bacterium]